MKNRNRVGKDKITCTKIEIELPLVSPMDSIKPQIK